MGQVTSQPITSIGAYQIGDGNGGKTPLSIISGKVLDILSNEDFQWRYATQYNITEAKAGTISYKLPELIKISDYDNATYGKGAASQIPQVANINITLDSRRFARYSYEIFDVERILQSDYMMGQIASGLARSHNADLNGQFWNRVLNVFSTGGALENNNSQKIPLSFLGSGAAAKKSAAANNTLSDYIAKAPDQMYSDYLTLEETMMNITTSFSSYQIGSKSEDITTILSPQADIDMRTAFRNQPNLIGTWQISPTLVGTQIGNLKYVKDAMLDQLIPQNQSFNGDYAINTQDIIGIMFHKEAIAMPLNVYSVKYEEDPLTGNPIWISRIQFGLGLVRPWLIYVLYRAKTTPFTTVRTYGNANAVTFVNIMEKSKQK